LIRIFLRGEPAQKLDIYRSARPRAHSFWKNNPKEPKATEQSEKPQQLFEWKEELGHKEGGRSTCPGFFFLLRTREKTFSESLATFARNFVTRKISSGGSTDLVKLTRPPSWGEQAIVSSFARFSANPPPVRTLLRIVGRRHESTCDRVLFVSLCETDGAAPLPLTIIGAEEWLRQHKALVGGKNDVFV
jgi:hypothetical protein